MDEQLKRPETLRAISLHQPWATAVALGSKTIETRSWSTEYRGELVIHAAKKFKHVEMDHLLNFNDHWKPALVKISSIFDSGRSDSEYWHPGTLKEILPLGSLVATCRLLDCVPVERLLDISLMRVAGTYKGHVCHERNLGNYDRGRYAWILDNIRPIHHGIPWKGHQSFFSVPYFTVKEIEAERERQVAMGFDAHHDDLHSNGEILRAAQCYACAARDPQFCPEPGDVPHLWPFEPEAWKMNDDVPNMVKAAALYAAEHQRVERMEARIQK